MKKVKTQLDKYGRNEMFESKNKKKTFENAYYNSKNNTS